MFTHPLFTFLLRINQQICWREHEEIHNSKKLYNMEPLQELICEIVSRKGFTRVQFIFYWGSRSLPHIPCPIRIIDKNLSK